jgi:hypothetical protein
MFDAIDTAARRTCAVKPKRSDAGNLDVTRYTSSTSPIASRHTLSS